MQWVYGLRDAPKAFEFRLRAAFLAAGYAPGVFSACCYNLKKFRCTYVVHGDDFIGVGPKKHLKAFAEHLRKYFTVKEMAYLGPGCTDKEARILNWIITYKPAGSGGNTPRAMLTWEADSRHLQLAARHF